MVSDVLRSDYDYYKQYDFCAVTLFLIISHVRSLLNRPRQGTSDFTFNLIRLSNVGVFDRMSFLGGTPFLLFYLNSVNFLPFYKI